MRRLRGIVVGILLLAGVIFAAEYYLSTHQEVVAKYQKNHRDLLLGWTPSQSLYLLPPVSRNLNTFSDNGKTTVLRYDENGFRIALQASTQKNHLLFLGDEQTLSPRLEAEQTFVFHWQQMQDQYLQRFSMRSGRFINAAQPYGCPLLWLLQDSARFSEMKTQFVLCVIDPQTFANDFQIRRTMTFNENGFPINGDHPYASPVKSKQPTQIDTLLQSQLAKLGLPKLFELFLGKRSPAQSSYAPGKSNTHLMAPEANEALAQLALSPLLELRKAVQSRGSEMILVYLPDAVELQKMVESRSHKGPPVILTTEMGSEKQPPRTRRSTETSRDFVRQFAIQHKFRLCDTSEILSQQQEPTELLMNDQASFSATGHQKIAEILMDYFSAQTARADTETINTQ